MSKVAPLISDVGATLDRGGLREKLGRGVLINGMVRLAYAIDQLAGVFPLVGDVARGESAKPR